MEQNRESRYKPKHKWSIKLQKEVMIYNGEKIAFSTNGAGKMGQLHARKPKPKKNKKQKQWTISLHCAQK